ncbi:hypothetical protein, partial [Mesorhizobium sp.]|uniref:hypothetical protein n=1 Tax=Mesorhizobium sp. TaxID=1871066 RepID=UPI00345C17E5
QVKLCFAASSDSQVLQDFSLKRRAEAFDWPDATCLCRRFELSQRVHAERLMKLHYLVGPEPGYGKQLHYTRRHLLAQLLKA